MVKSISYESKRKAALFKPLIFVVIAALAVALIYSSSSTFLVFGKKEVIDISCSPQDGTTRCCGDEVDYDKFIYGYTGVTYCTTCDNTSPPSNCGPREKIERHLPTIKTPPEPGSAGIIEQPPTNVAPLKTCPDGSALDTNGKCLPNTNQNTQLPSSVGSENQRQLASNNNNNPSAENNPKSKGNDLLGQIGSVGGGESTATKKGSNSDNSPTPPPCPKDNSPIPPNCTLKPKF
jgi:hypothetical protein